MKKHAKKHQLSITKVVKLIGKPTYFLFKVIVFAFVEYVHLLNTFIHQVTKILSSLSKKGTYKKKFLPKPKHSYTLFSGIGCLILASCFYFYILKDLPSASSLSNTLPSLSTKIYDRNGILLYQIYKDENRSLINISDLPSHIIEATLAAEDKDFYTHHGISIAGIIRAATNNLSNDTVQGGSTITQQLVKNTLLSPERTIIRKVKEILLAIRVEQIYSKNQILEMYLNQVGYGGTSYGIEQASWQYFGKHASDLNLAESSMLAGLTISPTILSPFGTNPHMSKIRQQQVLDNMVKAEMITENEKLSAISAPLTFHQQGVEIRAPHFVMYIKDLLVKQFGESMVARGGLTVTTTLDLNVQEILQAEINTELTKLEKLHVKNGAGLVVSPSKGEILAMVGSRDFFDSSNDGQVNIVLQERQPGSSIKPITYSLALSRGLSPSSFIEDSPICFTSKGQPNYCPKNYDGRFHGKVTLRTALASSYNIPAIKLLNTYGLSSMIDLAKQLGITTWDDSSRFGLSLTLGSGEVTMLDLASVYSVFANDGIKVPFVPVLSVKDSQGQSLTINLETSSMSNKEVLAPAIAYQINSILSDPFARAPSFGLNSVLNLPGKNVAVKTGTTNSLRDNWTIGYTKDLLVATWVGNNDNTPMSSVASGITGASPIWARTFQALMNGLQSEPFTPPPTMLKARISCAEPSRYEFFVKGTEPKIDCTKSVGEILDGVTTSAQ